LSAIGIIIITSGQKVMKRSLLLISILLLPLTVCAMTPLNDTELSDICGQAGISIMPDITMNIYFGVIAWGDPDGLGTNNIWGEITTGGYIGVTNLSITNLYIGPRTDYPTYDASNTTTIEGAKIISHSVEYRYPQIDLSLFQNSFATLNLK